MKAFSSKGSDYFFVLFYFLYLRFQFFKTQTLESKINKILNNVTKIGTLKIIFKKPTNQKLYFFCLKCRMQSN